MSDNIYLVHVHADFGEWSWIEGAFTNEADADECAYHIKKKSKYNYMNLGTSVISKPLHGSCDEWREHFEEKGEEMEL